MNTTLFVVGIAVVTVLLTTIIQVSMRGRAVSPRTRRLLWALVIAGLAALAITMIYVAIR